MKLILEILLLFFLTKISGEENFFLFQNLIEKNEKITNSTQLKNEKFENLSPESNEKNYFDNDNPKKEMKNKYLNKILNKNYLNIRKLNSSNYVNVIDSLEDSVKSYQGKKIVFENLNFTECGSIICFDIGGSCDIVEKCNCNPGFIDQKDNPILRCTYKQYDAKIAFFLEFFLGFGAGHFYVKRYINAIIKCSIYLFLYLIVGMVNFIYSNKKNYQINYVFARFGNIISFCICSFTCIIWQIADSILLYSLFYNDGNDFPLYLYE